MAGLERMTTGSAVSALPYLATQVDTCCRPIALGAKTDIIRVYNIIHTLFVDIALRFTQC